MDATSVTLTYDALGRMVEQNRSGVYKQIVYSTTGGKLALMNGQTLSKAFVPLPAGATAVYTSSGLAYYRHSDWLGSSRLATTPSRTKYYDGAYAPFGENYAGSGTTDLNFTGQNQDTVANYYDFLFREYSMVQGRWMSPDPAGMAVADPGNPQSWNRYAYVLNSPLNLVDPFGLHWIQQCYPNPDGDGSDCIWVSVQDPESAPQNGLECWFPETGTYGSCFTALRPQSTGEGPPTAGCDPHKAGKGGCMPDKPSPKQQRCDAAKANLAAIEKQGNTMAMTMLKETGVGAGIGCVVGFMGTEELFPVVGTPLAVGDCAVGAIGFGLTAVATFAIANAGDIVSGNISEAKAVAQVVQNCF
ncbi:MAG: RHS repeat-associated core domain-containing protein [Acidobacteriia bacterium]|nr:RHS repeat-associated core domain-containing protein [Terriglobia bacterium]